MRKSKSISNIQHTSGSNSETESKTEDQHSYNKWICFCSGKKPSSCCTAKIKSSPNIDKMKEIEGSSSSSLSSSLSDISSSTLSKEQQIENWIYCNQTNHSKSSKIKARKHKKRVSLGNVSSLSSSCSDVSTLSKDNFHVKTGLTTSTQLSIRFLSLLEN